MTTKPNDLRIWASAGSATDPGNAKYQQGWVIEAPSHEVMNFIQQQITQMLLHVNERGIASWDSVTAYTVGSIVIGADNIAYKCLVDSTNDEPSISPTEWELLVPTSSGGTTVVDNLVSTATDEALSANMGRELNATKALINKNARSLSIGDQLYLTSDGSDPADLVP